MKVMLLHDLGAADAGDPWRAAAPADWVVPDLPGHGSTPAPRHGAYDPMAAVTLARWELEGDGLVVGVGQNAHAALVLAAGGGCSAVAIVDGLWDPWRTEAEMADAMYAGLRRVRADTAATAPPPESGLDPRASHGYAVHMSSRFAQRFWAAVTTPVLAVETPSSPTPPEEREERVSWFGGLTALAEVGSADPSVVVAAIDGWATSL